MKVGHCPHVPQFVTTSCRATHSCIRVALPLHRTHNLSLRYAMKCKFAIGLTLGHPHLLFYECLYPYTKTDRHWLGRRSRRYTHSLKRIETCLRNEGFHRQRLLYDRFTERSSLFSHGRFIEINSHRASEVHGCTTGQKGQWHLTSETHIKRKFILCSLSLTEAIIGR